MILDKLVKHTEERLKNKKINLPIESLKDKLNNKVDINNTNINNTNSKYSTSFEESLKNDGISFICEVKKASPSKGMICNDFDPVKIAKEYENAGAAAISVLTEPHFFKGNDNYLSSVVDNVSLPVLRKDFVIDEYMIYEAKLLGASAVLLITSILSYEQLKKFIALAYSLNICPLVETHTKEEIKIAIDAGAKVIGINNRNLKDFTVDVNNTINLQDYIPEDIRNDVIIVSESGITKPEDIKILSDNNINAVLIGEYLMKSNSKKIAIEKLKSLV
ncbi:indole-3-glycerol phosphate synthase TrpC [Methanobrevibacter filiformis]|uniref:Indole-3-glycerol phosphate synthase n=1 Tax=Methanobrevibacter filiformis TaxID=55758 RepID=A0A165ZSE7_9EURY|nr:indole-3-glycerol phosphate synthase TrpC [Methanobrevibacter filiformis]KZX11099.1 indole-3-glycerol phosphate synthase [Methanobrevibacter filiformis]